MTYCHKGKKREREHGKRRAAQGAPVTGAAPPSHDTLLAPPSVLQQSSKATQHTSHVPRKKTCRGPSAPMDGTAIRGAGRGSQKAWQNYTRTVAMSSGARVILLPDTAGAYGLLATSKPPSPLHSSLHNVGAWTGVERESNADHSSSNKQPWLPSHLLTPAVGRRPVRVMLSAAAVALSSEEKSCDMSKVVALPMPGTASSGGRGGSTPQRSMSGAHPQRLFVMLGHAPRRTCLAQVVEAGQQLVLHRLERHQRDVVRRRLGDKRLLQAGQG